MRCVRPGLHDVGELAAPCASSASARCSQRGDQVVDDGRRSRRRGCATGRRRCDDWVALTWSFGCTGSAQPLGCEGGDHLVGVHVRRGAGAGLEHVDRELVVPARPPRPRRRPRAMASATSASSTPSSALTARGGGLDPAQRVRCAPARAAGRRSGSSRPRAGSVARHWASAGTRTSPIESCSTRVVGVIGRSPDRPGSSRLDEADHRRDQVRQEPCVEVVQDPLRPPTSSLTTSPRCAGSYG